MMQAVMHVHMIAIAVGIALFMRWLSYDSGPSARVSQQSWQLRWTKALSAFVVPPLFLLMTAIAIVTMGITSCHAWEGLLSYGISLAFVLLAGAIWLQLSWQVMKSQQTTSQYALKTFHTPLGSVLARVIDMPFAFSAQVGFWSPELVISQPIVRHLEVEQLTAVFAHERGHAHYRDTFWFFWLGGLRRLTAWLPGTQSLWQELLLLRELRADRWATQFVDKLVIAESLMQVVSIQRDLQALKLTEDSYAAFSMPALQSRLEQRIDALLSDEVSAEARVEGKQIVPTHWRAIAWSLTPLLTIPFHH
ncbi:MAG: M56 family metallopeptidase [Cyanobacteria bacterium J06634_6]